jgi:hypothetical protein
VTDDDYHVPSGDSVALSGGAAWGLAGLAIGCTLLVAACVLMVFNVILFSLAPDNVPLDWAQLGGAVGVGGVALLGLLAVFAGVRGWSAAARRGESVALGVTGTAAGVAGLVAWLIAGIDLLLVLRLF